MGKRNFYYEKKQNIPTGLVQNNTSLGIEKKRYMKLSPLRFSHTNWPMVFPFLFILLLELEPYTTTAMTHMTYQVIKRFATYAGMNITRYKRKMCKHYALPLKNVGSKNVIFSFGPIFPLLFSKGVRQTCIF